MVTQTEILRRITLFSKVNNVAIGFQNSNKKNKVMGVIDFRDQEVLSFFKSLEDFKVKYILVGGFAMAYHGHVRATHDLDIWVKNSNDNIEKFISVLTAHGVQGLQDLRSFEMISGFTQFQIGDSGFVVEPFKSLKTLSEYDFDAAYERAENGTFYEVQFKVIHAKDLLKEKEATNRPKDQGDIEHLRSL